MATGLDQWLGKLEGHNEIGEALTSQLQKAEEEVQQFIGGQLALKVAADKVGALGVTVDEDLNAGKLNFDSELKAAEYIKKTIIRARECVLNLGEGAKSKEISAAGKVAALTESRKFVMRHTMAAKARADQLQAAVEEARRAAEESAKEQDPTGNKEVESSSRKPRQRRASGERPSPSFLVERRAEAAKERETAKIEVVAKKKKGRPSKGKK